MTTIYDILDAVPDIGDQFARELTIARMAFEAGQEQRVTQPPQQSSRPVKAVEPFAWCIESSNSADWCFSKTKAGAIHNASLMDDDCIQTEPFPLYKSPIVQPVAEQPVALESSVGHLSALVDELRRLLGAAMQTMSELHVSAEPDESTADIDARIPGAAFAKFVNEHAQLLFEIKNGCAAAPVFIFPAAAVAEGAQLDGESLEQAS